MRFRRNPGITRIVDYFSDVEVQGINAEKDEFLGKEWISVKIPLRDMKKGEIKTVTYNTQEAKEMQCPVPTFTILKARDTRCSHQKKNDNRG
jgi:hypothetical protein